MQSKHRCNGLPPNHMCRGAMNILQHLLRRKRSIISIWEEVKLPSKREPLSGFKSMLKLPFKNNPKIITKRGLPAFTLAMNLSILSFISYSKSLMRLKAKINSTHFQGEQQYCCYSFGYLEQSTRPRELDTLSLKKSKLSHPFSEIMRTVAVPFCPLLSILLLIILQ